MHQNDLKVVHLCINIKLHNNKMEMKLIRHNHIASNFYEVKIESLTIWFSYSTPIAFESYGQKFVSQNDWGTTTGKHINSISRDKKIRMEHEAFKLLLNHNININFVDATRKIMDKTIAHASGTEQRVAS